MTEPDVPALLERGAVLQKINNASPSAREMVDAFGEDSLFVILHDGTECAAYVDAKGVVRPAGEVREYREWRVKIARPEYGEGRNHLRHQLYLSMCQRKHALQTEDLERKHDTTNHVQWTDGEGQKRSAPEEAADRGLEKNGIAPGTHPKVWRPSA